MLKLVLLYWGTVFLMSLSQMYCPADPLISGPQIGKRHFMWRNSDIFMVIVIAWLTCFSFLRTNYNDTWTYMIHFLNAESVSDFLAAEDAFTLTGNPLSLLYRNFIREFTDNYHIYFFFPAFLSSFFVVKFFKRYSVNPAFSLLIFFSIGTYTGYIAALKQSIAMCFLLAAIPYALEKKYIRFYLLLLVAVLFHTHAFMFAIVPFLTEKPWGKTTWALLGLMVFAMVTYDSTLGTFMEYMQSIGALVDEGELFDGNSINVMRVMVYWVPALLALVFRKRLFSTSTRTENLLVNMSILSSFILTIGLVQAANLFARMAAYFDIATAIALPWIIQKLFNKQSAQLVTVCAGILYFGYFCYDNINRGFANDYSAITLWQFIQSLFA